MAYVQKRGASYKVRGKEPAYDETTGAVLRDRRGRIVMRDVSFGTFDNWTDADKHRKKIDGELVTTGRTLDHAAGRETFGTFAADWMETKRSAVANGRLKERTADDYADLLRRYVLPVFAARPIGSITPHDAEKFHAALVKRGLARSTVKHGYDVFRWALAYAARRHAIGINPAEGIDTSGHADGYRFEGTPLSRDQVAAVVAAVGERSEVYALAVRFLASTGLRAAEFAGLEVADLRLVARAGGGAKGSVRVARTKRWKAGECIEGTPKSKKSRRTVPLPPGLAGDLRAYLDDVHPDGSDPAAPLFPGRVESRGGAKAKGQRGTLAPVVLDWSRPVNPSALYKSVVLPAYAAAGLPDGTRLHDLRHTYATLQLMAGEPYQKVSRWLGHASFVVTLTIYAHWIEDEDEESSLDFAPSSASAEQAREKTTNRTTDDNVIPIRAAQ
ncbi:tyrosine-type recombinase/integrase [Actinomycetospora cinnamomea]|uniref:Site-specific recombinase XerD n=1 Tax=Actinomycetospora cinnamomea TaxID=663609 RepID=A0A2U1FDA1_9PSEU|nr:site-specific integrase [Actinomycetospora cinnamomea]PVZ10162.1 site-specific recombinase XerD [Actinomycetospora cinnamomea]